MSNPATTADASLIDGSQVVHTLGSLGISHVVFLPDAVLGRWEPALAAGPIKLVKVCREGEAWPLAMGLHIGGARPLVVMQSTGLFESGDAMRNVLYDCGVPLYAIIGYRSYLIEGSNDTARRFTEPIVAAWQLDSVLVGGPHQWHRFAEHYQQCRAAGRPGITLLAEGRS